MSTRRTFLIGSAAVVGGLAIGYRYWDLPPKLPDSIPLGAGQVSLTPYVVIDQAGITLIAPRAEMGQGIHTTLAALVAEELDVSLDAVRVEHGPASELYSNWEGFGRPPYEGRVHGVPTQFTGGQTSIKDAFVKMRKAGAAARIVLVKAAAEALGTEPERLSTQNGAVVDPSGARLSYEELAEAAASFDLPEDPELKPRAEWRLLGTSLPRVDMLAKCTGTARFATDVKLPGLLYGVAKTNPHLGGIMQSFDASKALAMRGVKAVVPMETGFVVVATNTWYALQAADAVDVDWGPAPYPESTEGHWAVVARELDRPHAYRPLDLGDVEGALAGDDSLVGEYRAPYLAHATMEPMNATCVFAKGRLEIWAGNQNPTRVVETCSNLAGIEPDAVTVHTTYMGGGFGRRLEQDAIRTAVHAALAMEGTPVKVTWSREQDTAHDSYRPLAMARYRAAVSDGRPQALDLRLSSPSLLHRDRETHNEDGVSVPYQDKFLSTGAREQPYAIPNYRVTAHQAPNLLPVGFWRSVGESQNSFFHESIMDELAHAAGADPLMMRLSLLDHAPSREVLEAVAEMSNWGAELPEGHARGVAYVLSSGAATAQVIEIESTKAGIRILKAFVAADFGVALDPRNIEAQLHSAFVYGLTAAIQGEITVSDGVVEQTNFHDYPLLRMDQSP
ncbi:MAG: molybdopterin cofactor-binding domain-containing protein, partial [Pseudomonadota bacterium]